VSPTGWARDHRSRTRPIGLTPIGPRELEVAHKVIPDGWLSEAASCCVCGRSLDAAVPIIESRLRGRVLQACAQPCPDGRSAAVGDFRNGPARAMVRHAERLKNFYADICAASLRGEIPFREALPMLQKMLDEQCRLLWVTGPPRS
jgi:hypothetical protein